MSRVLTRFPQLLPAHGPRFYSQRLPLGGIDLPDLILHSGKIITLSSDFRIVEFLAVRAGKILAIGSNAEIGSLATSKTLDSIWKGAPSFPI